MIKSSKKQRAICKLKRKPKSLLCEILELALVIVFAQIAQRVSFHDQAEFTLPYSSSTGCAEVRTRRFGARIDRAIALACKIISISKMTFIQRAIVLLAMPILAQFIFVLVLLGAFRTVEQINYKDIQYRNQTTELMGISMLCYRAIGMITAYGYSKDESFLKGFDNIYDRLSRKAELLNLIATSESSTSPRKAMNGLSRVLSGLAEARRMLDFGVRSVGSRPLRAAELEHDLSTMLSDMETLLSERARIGLEESKRIEQSRSMFLSAVVLGFVANMIVSAILLAIFARDFASRFNIIVDNTNRLPQGLSLNPPIEGKDELAALDSFFHRMTAELKLIEERKEQLVAMVTHDLRNPLTALKLSLDTMTSGFYGTLSPELTKRVQSLNKIVNRLSRLVNDILDLEKLRSGKLKLSLAAIDLRPVAQECITELESIAKASGVTVVEKIGDDVMVVADRERIAQVLINLLGNALKFSPVGAEVSIESEDSFEFVKIMVKDRGPGVPENFRELIFLPFEQVPDKQRPKKGSTGLGLPISKMLVDLHGGKIGVDSSSAGSTFWFTLPKAEIESL